MNRRLNIFEPKRYYKSYNSDKCLIYTDIEIDDEIEIRLIFDKIIISDFEYIFQLKMKFSCIDTVYFSSMKKINEKSNFLHRLIRPSAIK